MSNIENHLLQYGIAIVGMAGRFPGASTTDEFWDNIKNGIESIKFFSDAELAAAGVPEKIRIDPNYVPAKGIIDDIEGFDASFFNINPREAELIDPQQRVFLECAWEVLENAGYDPDTFPGKIGVFASASKNTYLLFNLMTCPELHENTMASQVLIANEKDYISTRTSYKLNLRGPSITVQAACSSSMVALHLACQSLMSGECEMAIAGAAAIDVPHKSGYLYQAGGIFSPDGHCRVFDDSARGTVFGQGVGSVLLKPLAKALADKDTIHAVIRSSAINNDGANKTGFTAPGVEGQADVIIEAIALANIDASTISYIEAHGTGTALGDPIEVEALKIAFSQYTNQQHFCALGSVKTNIGHLNSASGIAGLIKTVLSIKHGEIPRSLNFERPNKQIDFVNSPFYVNQNATFHADSPRRAGVSSFGIGGTNAHVVLEQAPLVQKKSSDDTWQLIPVSARSQKALLKAKIRLGEFIKLHQPQLEDVAYTLQVGRRAFAHRFYVICRTLDHAVAALLGENDYPTVSSDERYALLQGLGDRWLAGSLSDWGIIHEVNDNYRIPLPTYPFEHKRYWIERRELQKNESRHVNQRSDSALDETVEQQLLVIFKKLLGFEDLEINSNFFMLGGDSLLGVELIALVKDKFKLNLPLNALFESPTIEEIAKLIETAQTEGVAKALAGRTNEAALDLQLAQNIQPQSEFQYQVNPTAILLTGATGFLGSFILHELLEKTTATIYCLVRTVSVDEGFARIQKVFHQYSLSGLDQKDRIHIVPGDLSEPQFGLDTSQYQALAGSIYTIYHCGARLSFIDPYCNLRKINVQGTRHIIEFACHTNTKHLHHVSSIAVYDSENYAGLTHADESLSLENSRGFNTGYDETKWVSEMLVAEAEKRGVPVTVYRPGNISGDSRTGVCSATDLIGIMMRGCIDLGYAPDNDAYVDVVPIDYVSRALVNLSLRKEAIGEKYNLVNTTPMRWTSLVNMIQAVGYTLQTEPFPDWCERLRFASQRGSNNLLIPLLPLFDDRPLFSNRCYSGQKVKTCLQGTAIECRAIDANLFNMYTQHLVEKGFLNGVSKNKLEEVA